MKRNRIASSSLKDALCHYIISIFIKVALKNTIGHLFIENLECWSQELDRKESVTKRFFN